MYLIIAATDWIWKTNKQINNKKSDVYSFLVKSKRLFRFYNLWFDEKKIDNSYSPFSEADESSFCVSSSVSDFVVSFLSMVSSLSLALVAASAAAILPTA